MRGRSPAGKSAMPRPLSQDSYRELEDEIVSWKKCARWKPEWTASNRRVDSVHIVEPDSDIAVIWDDNVGRAALPSYFWRFVREPLFDPSTAEEAYRFRQDEAAAVIGDKLRVGKLPVCDPRATTPQAAEVRDRAAKLARAFGADAA